uniref:Uncharacterized protein n=1 Tax=Oryzias melastigma TaxID=30732 RepID=A0A3B3CA14_ORYME
MKSSRIKKTCIICPITKSTKLNENVSNKDNEDDLYIGIYKQQYMHIYINGYPEDVGIIIEGVTILQDLHDNAPAFHLLFGLMYVLNLSYPRELRYTLNFARRCSWNLRWRSKLFTKNQQLWVLVTSLVKTV